MTRADVPIGLLLVLGCLWVLWQATGLQYGTEFTPGPGFAPVWYSLVGLVLALAVALSAWRGHQGTPVENGGRPGLIRVVLALVGLALMIPLISGLGFVPGLLVYLLFLSLGIERLPLLTGLGASVGTMAFIYLVFVRLLGVPFPSGPLGI